eukprot:5476915-Prymnesium_polylepis.1
MCAACAPLVPARKPIRVHICCSERPDALSAPNALCVWAGRAMIQRDPYGERLLVVRVAAAGPDDAEPKRKTGRKSIAKLSRKQKVRKASKAARAETLADRAEENSVQAQGEEPVVILLTIRPAQPAQPCIQESSALLASRSVQRRCSEAGKPAPVGADLSASAIPAVHFARRELLAEAANSRLESRSRAVGLAGWGLATCPLASTPAAAAALRRRGRRAAVMCRA